MICHYGGGIGHLQDVCSVGHEQNDMVQDDSAAEDDTKPRSESNVAVENLTVSRILIMIWVLAQRE